MYADDYCNTTGEVINIQAIARLLIKKKFCDIMNKYYKKHNIDEEFPNNMKQEWIDELLN